MEKKIITTNAFLSPYNIIFGLFLIGYGVAGYIKQQTTSSVLTGVAGVFVLVFLAILKNRIFRKIEIDDSAIYAIGTKDTIQIKYDDVTGLTYLARFGNSPSLASIYYRDGNKENLVRFIPDMAFYDILRKHHPAIEELKSRITEHKKILSEKRYLREYQIKFEI